MLTVIIICIYIFDKTMCFFYCSLKSKRENTNAKSVINAIIPKKAHGFKWKVQQLLYGWMMYSVMRLGKVPCQKYRIFVLKHIYKMKIMDKVVIYGNFKIRAPWNIYIGSGTVVGDGVQLDGRNGLIIGENVNISSEAFIYTEQHDVNDEYFESGTSGGSVMIENRAWISSRTTILPGVSIGEGAVLASGAIATKNLESFSIYAGIPARKISSRNNNLNYEFDGSFIPFY